MITEEETTTASSSVFYKSDLTPPRVPEKTALPADGAVAETLELFADEYNSLNDVSMSGVTILRD